MGEIISETPVAEESVSADLGRQPLPVLGQAKLVVGGAHDPQEREADDVADLIVRAMQSKTFSDPVEPSDGVQRVQRVQRSAVAQMGAAGGLLDADTEQRVQRARSGGQPLEARLQRSVGTAIGADVSGVRVHRSAESAELNRRMGARAFTVGNDVFLGDGAPSTQSEDGLRLVAHEVAHTVQQGASPVRREFDDRDGPTAEPAGAGDDSSPELAGTISVIEAAASPEDVTGLAKLEEDGVRAGPSKSRRRSGRSGSSKSATRTTSFPVSARVGTSTTVTERDGLVDDVDGDELVGRNIATTTAIGSYAASAFGAMRTSIDLAGLNWELADGKVQVDCTIRGSLDWGVNAGGRTDVPTPNASFITKDNYAAIANDLTPVLERESWRPPRTQYWSSALTGRHERFHADDAAGWITREGPGVLSNYLAANPITLTDDERKDSAKVRAKLVEVLIGGLNQVIDGRVFYFRAGLGSSDYLIYPGEIRAFGDGRQPYQDLADGIRSHGQQLAAAAATPAPTPTPTSAPTGGGAG